MQLKSYTSFFQEESSCEDSKAIVDTPVGTTTTEGDCQAEAEASKPDEGEPVTDDGGKLTETSWSIRQNFSIILKINLATIFPSKYLKQELCIPAMKTY